MWTFASIMDFSHSALFFDLSFHFAFFNLYTIPPSVFQSSSQLTSLRIIVKYLMCFCFATHSVNMTSPIQPTQNPLILCLKNQCCLNFALWKGCSPPLPWVCHRCFISAILTLKSFHLFTLCKKFGKIFGSNLSNSENLLYKRNLLELWLVQNVYSWYSVPVNNFMEQSTI